ncbi:MAG: helix-turn-helix domain-containing protein [Alphaproteobacteria bacterium]|mgnify:CR=1 FL=1
MTKQHKHYCPISRALNLVGDSWTLLVVREAFYGATRFNEFRTHTGIAKNILSDRLAMLVEQGVMDRQDIGDKGTRYAYTLTQKGKDLFPVLMSMAQWGDKWAFAEEGPQVGFEDKDSGKRLGPMKLAFEDGSLVTRPANLRPVARKGAHPVVKARFANK